MVANGAVLPGRVPRELPAPPNTVTRAAVRLKGTNMHPEELMKPDLLSEVVLLAFGTLVLTSLVLCVMTTLARS
jgi:hypothetical protein